VLHTLVEQTSLFTKETGDRSGNRRVNDVAPVVVLDPFSAGLGVCLLLVLEIATRSDGLGCEIVVQRELDAY
jgi:hypothetical protein